MQVQRLKKTELGEIPEEWTIEKIENFLNINMGQSPSSKFYNQENKGLPFYQGVSDFNEIYPTPRIWCSDTKKIANLNEILFSVRAPVGEINLTNEKCCIGRGIASLIPKNADIKYCFYLLKYFKNKFSTYSQGSTFDAINRSQIANVKVPYTYEVKEQQKIASILSNVDNLIQKTDQVIEQTQRLKKGLMQRLLTKGIGHTKFKKTELGEIPEEWKINNLGDLSYKITKGIFDLSPDNYVDKGIPFLRISDIVNNNIHILHTKNISMEIHLKNRNTELSSGDIVLAKVGASAGSTEKIARIPDSIEICNISQNLIGIRVNKKLCQPDYLENYLVQPHVMKRVLMGSNTTTFKSIQLDVLRKLAIPLPSLVEQQKIASILSNIDILIQKLQVKKKSEEKLKKSLMQQLLTGKIRVKV